MELAAQVEAAAPPGLLNTYHAERHPAGERMLSFVRAQGVLLSPGAHVTALRELMGELLTHQQTLRYVVDRLLGLDIRYDLDADGAPAHPLVGGWAPDLPLRANGGDTRLATLMHGARPVLLDLTADGRLRARGRIDHRVRPRWPAATSRWTGSWCAQTGTWRGPPLPGTTTQTDSAKRCRNGSAWRAEHPLVRTGPTATPNRQTGCIGSRPGSPATRSKGHHR